MCSGCVKPLFRGAAVHDEVESRGADAEIIQKRGAFCGSAVSSNAPALRLRFLQQSGQRHFQAADFLRKVLIEGETRESTAFFFGQHFENGRAWLRMT